MQISDTIADMLTRIRNASSAKHESVDVPASNMKKSYKKSWISCGFYRFSLFRNNILCIDFFIYLYAVTEK